MKREILAVDDIFVMSLERRSQSEKMASRVISRRDVQPDQPELLHPNTTNQITSDAPSSNANDSPTLHLRLRLRGLPGTPSGHYSPLTNLTLSSSGQQAASRPNETLSATNDREAHPSAPQANMAATNLFLAKRLVGPRRKLCGEGRGDLTSCRLLSRIRGG